MPSTVQVVVTGIGVVSPIGIGCAAMWDSLHSGQGGIRPIRQFDATGFPVRFGGEVADFDPRQYVKPRKSLKVMARDAQFAVAAADLARSEARLGTEVDPDRFGVILGAGVMRPDLDEIATTYRACLNDGEFEFSRWGPYGMPQCYPLGMLRLLPNMLASHISITQDARGPNNTICQGDVSGLLAIGEAARVIERGQADVMLAGAARCPLHPHDLLRASLLLELSRRNDQPERACCPFDVQHSGQVLGEGACVLVLESASHAKARRAEPQARVAGWASSFEPQACHAQGEGTRRAIVAALADAQLGPAELDYVSAQGLSTVADDRREAQILAELLPDLPVWAPKCYFGNSIEATGALETAANVLALAHRAVPASLNFEQPDPECPVRIVAGGPRVVQRSGALVMGRTAQGQCVALVLAEA